MLQALVRNIVTRSIPIPQPAVGGRPYSRAVQNPSSTTCASSSPASLSCGVQMIGYFMHKIVGGAGLPELVVGTFPFVQLDHLIQCKHCKFLSDIHIVQISQ